MENPPPLPPPPLNLSITYSLNRRDLFAAFSAAVFHNRILQVFILAMLAVNGWITIAPGFSRRSAFENIFEIVGFLFLFVIIMAVCHCILGLALSYLRKAKGVLGEHTLEITDGGLIERTAYNEHARASAK